MNVKERLRAAARFALKHLGVSALIAAICAATRLLRLVSVPLQRTRERPGIVCAGRHRRRRHRTALSFAVFNPSKPRAELWRDLGIIFILQLGALSYGMYSVTQARPVWLAFEGDQFRIVAVPDVDANELSRAPEGFGGYSWTGPKTIRLSAYSRTPIPSMRRASSSRCRAFIRPFARSGGCRTTRSGRWRSRKAKSLSELRRKRPNDAPKIDAAGRRQRPSGERSGISSARKPAPNRLECRRQPERRFAGRVPADRRLGLGARWMSSRRYVRRASVPLSTGVKCRCTSRRTSESPVVSACRACGRSTR